MRRSTSLNLMLCCFAALLLCSSPATGEDIDHLTVIIEQAEQARDVREVNEARIAALTAERDGARERADESEAARDAVLATLADLQAWLSERLGGAVPDDTPDGDTDVPPPVVEPEPVPDPPVTPPPAKSPLLGVNLDSPSYWSTNWVYADALLQASYGEDGRWRVYWDHGYPIPPADQWRLVGAPDGATLHVETGKGVWVEGLGADARENGVHLYWPGVPEGYVEGGGCSIRSFWTGSNCSASCVSWTGREPTSRPRSPGPTCRPEPTCLTRT